ncbi:hypothetical protein [Candidatus Similichlamydia epinepheli]|uniref:hypothetical protein n=1 Tax=Candidatus Similichlamydia epinepheli TaxID=1903953 RepID=UPI000D3C63BD|nr:hypothetical protein [Candidatus Similichlamydia epinepheli]
MFQENSESTSRWGPPLIKLFHTHQLLKEEEVESEIGSIEEGELENEWNEQFLRDLCRYLNSRKKRITLR